MGNARHASSRTRQAPDVPTGPPPIAIYVEVVAEARGGRTDRDYLSLAFTLGSSALASRLA